MKTERGYSLVELMTIVAIVGILASIAVPSYRTARARALQKEGIMLLSEYYRGTKTMIAEYGSTPGNLVAVGFNPDGELTYRLEVADAVFAPPLGYPNDDGCVSTISVCDFQTEPPGWVETIYACASGQAPASAGKTFTAFACANLPNGNGTPDIMSIDETKTINYVQLGY